MAAAAGDSGASSPCRLRLGPSPGCPCPDLRLHLPAAPPAQILRPLPDSPPTPPRRSSRQDSPPPPPRRSPSADPPPARSPSADLPPARSPSADPPPARSPSADPPPARSPSADPPPPQVVAAAGAPPSIPVFDRQPSDIEMIRNYLMPFARDGARPDFIHNAEVYADGVGPELLSSSYEPALASDRTKAWLFFTHLVPLPGRRVKRQIPGLGTWKGERGNIEVKDAVTDVLLGHRRTLSFVDTASKTYCGWIMEEFDLYPASKDKNLVLCRVYRSPRTYPRRRPCPPQGSGVSSSSSSGPTDPDVPRAPPPPKSKRPRAALGSDPASRGKRSRGDQHAARNPKHAAAACEKESYSINNCVSEILKLDMSNAEKAGAFDIFKNPDNREIFLSSKEVNPEAAIIWLRKMISSKGLPFPSYPASSVGREDYGPDEHVEKHHSRPNMHKRSPDTLSIAIPEEYIGAVIGCFGRNVKDIMQATGAWIKTSAKGDFVAGTTDREVVISGTQEAIRAAKAMIMDSVARRRNGDNKKQPVKPDTTPEEVEQQ